jgi:GNAT superfamily N-acetyltransferase
VPKLVAEATLRDWLDPFDAPEGPIASEADPTVVPDILTLTPELLERLVLAPRVIAPADPRQARSLVLRALRDSPPGNRPHAVAAVAGEVVVGLAVDGMAERENGTPLLALGVAPAFRRRGLATLLLQALVARRRERFALVTVAERDPYEPLDHGLRVSIARRLLERAGFEVEAAGGNVGRVDPQAIVGRRG